MDPNLLDPNNHVPDVAPDDRWGDAEALSWKSGGLRSRRKTGEEEEEAKEVPDRAIEIAPRVIVPREEGLEEFDDADGGPVTRLEVQEINPRITRHERGSVPPMIVKELDPQKASEQPSIQLVAAGPFQKPDFTAAWGAAFRRTSTRWLVTAGGGVALLVVGVVIISLKFSNRDSGRREVTGFRAIQLVDPAENVVVETERGLGLDAEGVARDNLIAYAKAKTVDEILPLVRNRERLEGKLRKEWKPFPGDSEVFSQCAWTLRQAGDIDYGHIGGTTADFEPFNFFFVKERGRLVIDWEASMVTGDHSFEELSKGVGGGMTRAIISVGELYTFSVEEKDYQCFRLSAADRRTNVWGYVKRGSELETKIMSLFLPGPIPRDIYTEYPITLRLEPGPEDSLPNQWIIADMVGVDWVIP